MTLSAFKELLRDHYEGTKFDMTRGPAAGPFGSPNRWSGGLNEAEVQGGWERAISMHRTSWVFIVESRNPGDIVAAASVDDPESRALSTFPDLADHARLYAIPEAARTRVWFGWDSPHIAVMVPLYATQRIVPPSWTWAVQCKMSRTSAFW